MYTERHNMIYGLWPSTPLLGNSERLVNLNSIVFWIDDHDQFTPPLTHGTTCLCYDGLGTGIGVSKSSMYRSLKEIFVPLPVMILDTFVPAVPGAGKDVIDGF